MPRTRRTRTGEPSSPATDELAPEPLATDDPAAAGAVAEGELPAENGGAAEAPRIEAEPVAATEPTADSDQAAADAAGATTAGTEPGEPDDGEALEALGGVDAPSAEVLPSLIEALLFVSDGPVELRTLARALRATPTMLGGALEELRAQLGGRGLLLQTGPDGAQLVTAPHTAAHVEAFLGLEQQRKLSNAALETLAIVAYRQPVTRATIESIRGVSSDGAMQTLRARGLIEDAGRSQAPGRPTLFATTQRFLEHFGLRSAQDLPELGEIALPLPDASIPMPGLDEPAPPPSAIEDVAAELAQLSAAARALADPAHPRPGATVLLAAGPVTLALPAPVAEPPVPFAAPPPDDDEGAIGLDGPAAG